MTRISASRSSPICSSGVVGLGRGAVELEAAAELAALALEGAAAARGVDRAPAGDRGEPGAGVVRDPLARPLLERGDERVLGEVLGRADPAGVPRQTGEQARRLDPPDGFDRAPRLRRSRELEVSGRGLDVLGEVGHLEDLAHLDDVAGCAGDRAAPTRPPRRARRRRSASSRR